MYFDGIKRRFLRTGFHGLRIYTLTHIYTRVVERTPHRWYLVVFVVCCYSSSPYVFPLPAIQTIAHTKNAPRVASNCGWLQQLCAERWYPREG